MWFEREFNRETLLQKLLQRFELLAATYIPESKVTTFCFIPFM